MLLILLVEYVCLVVTSKLGIKIESTIGSIIILLLIMGPGLVLLYWLSGDDITAITKAGKEPTWNGGLLYV